MKVAIECLGAVQVSDNRYAFEYSPGHYATVNREGLEHLEQVLDERVPEAERVENEGASDVDGWYAADDRIIEMPLWWTPECRFAAECASCGKHSEDGSPFGVILCACKSDTRRITADLETGEEIPA